MDELNTPQPSPDLQTPFMESLNNFESVPTPLPEPQPFDPELGGWHAAFQDPVNNGGKTPEAIDASKVDENPQDFRDLSVNINGLAYLTGKNPTEVGMNYEQEKQNYVKSQNWDMPKTEAQFRNQLGGYMQDRFNRKEAVTELFSDTVMKALEDTDYGNHRGIADFPTDLTSVWQQKNAPLIPDQKERENYDKQSRAIYLKTLKDVAPIRKEIATSLKVLNDFTTGKAGDEDIQKLGAMFKDMDPKQMDKILSYVSVASQREKLDKKATKGFLQNLGESISRGADFAGDIFSQDDLLYMDQVGKDIEAGKPIYLTGVNGGDTKNLKWSNVEKPNAALTAMYGDAMNQKATPEQVETLKTQIADKMKSAKMGLKLKAFAQNAIDPITPLSKEGTWARTGEQMLYDVGSSIAPMGATAISPIAGFEAYKTMHLNDLLIKNPDKDLQHLSLIAGIEGAFEAVGDLFQIRLLKGIMPKIIDNYVKKLGSKYVRAGLRVVETFAGEYATETAQDALPAVVEGAATAMGDDIEQTATLEDFRVFDARRFWAIAFMGGVGAGVATFRDLKDPTRQLNRTIMGYNGVFGAQAEHVLAAESAEDADARWQEVYSARSPEDIAKGEEKLIQDKTPSKPKQADVSTPVKNAAGETEWVVTNPEGKEVGRFSEEQAAHDFVSDRIAAADLSEKNTVNDLLDYFISLDPNNVASRFIPQSVQKELDRMTGIGDAAGLANLHERIAFGKQAGDIKPDADLNEVFIMGGARLETISEGVFRGVISLADNAKVEDAAEEINHVFIKRALAEGRVTFPQLQTWIDQTNKATGTTYAYSSETDVMENTAKITLDYAAGRLDESVMPQSFVDYMKQLLLALKEVMLRVIKLKEAFADGKIDSKFEALLAESLGLDPQIMFDRESDRVAGEINPQGDRFKDSRLQPEAGADVRTVGDTSIVGPTTFSIRAYHGTPHDVDRFSTEKIGTGEGAQVYGWGLYFAQNRKVAQQYKERLTNDTLILDGVSAMGNRAATGNQIWAHASQYFADGFRTKESLLGKLNSAREYEKERGNKYFKDSDYTQVIDTLEKTKEIALGNEGSIYEVTIDAEENELLDWDKPLSEQSERIQREVFTQFGKILANDIKKVRRANPQNTEYPYNNIYEFTGYDAYQILSEKYGSAQKASAEMNKAGFKGIKYLDQGSRWKNIIPIKQSDGFHALIQLQDGSEKSVGPFETAEKASEAARNDQGTSNYVIFDDKHITITERNGEKVAVADVPVDGNTSYSIRARDEVADGFYSQLQKTVSDKMPNKASVEQIRAIIDPAKGSGVKPDEIKWSNLEGFLEGKKTVTKQEVLDYLKNEGSVKFEEKMFGAKPEEVLSTEDETRLAFLEKENAKAPLGAMDDVQGEGTYLEMMRLQNIRDKSTTEQLYSKQEQLERGARFEQKTNPKKADALWKESQHMTARAEALELQGAGMSEQPKFGQYVLAGGENYREVNLIDPSVEDWRDFPRAHVYGDSYDPVNMKRVAHMRLDERKDASGKDGLFIEEIQSDRHQAGREKGYNAPTPLEEIESSLANKYGSDWKTASTEKEKKQYLEAFAENRKKGQVPDAPFRKDWSVQMFKRALRDAVDSGKEWIGWTSGETQAERYDLSKQVNWIGYNKGVGENAHLYGIRAEGKNGETVLERSMTAEELPDAVGKEVAQKIVNGEGAKSDVELSNGDVVPMTKLSGLDLKVGGEGMKGFYDQILPKEIGKYVKKWGAKVEEATLPKNPQTTEKDADLLRDLGENVPDRPIVGDETQIWKVEITPEMRDTIKEGGQTMFSIRSQENIDSVTAAMQGSQSFAEPTLSVYERAKARFASVLEKNRDTLMGMQVAGASPLKIRNEKLKQALIELDGILKTLPYEVRGRVGGMAVLANIGTGDKALADFFKKRVEMLDKELERYLGKEYDEATYKFLQTTLPKKAAAGEKPKGIGADIQKVFATVREAQMWTSDEVNAHLAGLDYRIDNENLSPELEAQLTREADLVSAIGDWKNKTSDAKRQALEMLKSTWSKGYVKFLEKLVQQKAERVDGQKGAIASTGKDGVRSERQEENRKQNGLGGKFKQGYLNLISWDQFVSVLFGENSDTAKLLANGERAASNRKVDRTQAKMDEIADLFTKLAGSRLGGEKLRYEMAQKTIKPFTGTPWTGEEYSQLEALSVTMLWMQDDGKRHMMGKLDEAGNPMSNWHYNQDFVNTLEDSLSTEAKAVRSFLLDKYATGYHAINRVYTELNGVSLPQIANYSPVTVAPVKAPAGMANDPVTGVVVSGRGSSPSALRTRGVQIAEPQFRDVLQTYQAHTMAMEHWMAYAPFMKEINGILRNRDVQNAIEAKGGEEAKRVLNLHLDIMDQGGVRDAANQLGLTKILSKLGGRAAQVALVGRISTILLQSTQLGASLAEMPTGAYILRMSKLLSGNLGWGDALNSPYIQRRLAEMPPVVRQAMDGLHADKPNLLKHSVEKLGRLISGADALFTAGTYAMVYDYHLKQAKGMGIPSPEEYAHGVAERATDRLAQPTRSGARAVFENTQTGPFARVAWAFASESRKNLGLAAYALAERPAAVKARTLFSLIVLNSMVGTLIRNAWKDATDGDDDEVFDEKHWSLTRLAIATATDPLQGIPLLGDAVKMAAFKAAGQYAPSGNLYSMDGAISPFTHIGKYADGEADWEMAIKDLDHLASGMGMLNGNIAAAASLTHLASSLFGVGKNVVKSTTE